MERTRTPVGTPSWLWVNLAAMGLSLGHTVADLGIIFGSLSSGFGVPQSLLSVLIAATVHLVGLGFRKGCWGSEVLAGWPDGVRYPLGWRQWPDDH